MNFHTHMSEKKYVYANIRMPIEIVDNSYELLTEYMHIEFEKCDELPEKSTAENVDLIAKIFSFHNDADNVKEEVMRILKTDHENKTEKTRQNSSFRKKTKKIRDFTRRKYT